MFERLTLSVDAMGGDQAPSMVVEGISIALERLPDTRFLLFGDRAQLTPLLDLHPRAQQASEIRHTDDVVTNDEKAGVALRTGQNSSMRLAINAVGDGEAAGIISAGNTGALMAIAKFVLKSLPGIDRPAIGTYFPTLNGESVMLDLGANIECNAENLVQFAVMGEVFARNVLGLKNPSVGILNVGAEDLKGNDSVKQASTILQQSSLPIKFYGFVEGDDQDKGITSNGLQEIDGPVGDPVAPDIGFCETGGSQLVGCFAGSILAEHLGADVVAIAFAVIPPVGFETAVGDSIAEISGTF